jgi:hypothetical protein
MWGEKEKMKEGVSRNECRTLQYEHRVVPSRFLLRVNIFILGFHVVAVEAKERNKIELKVCDEHILPFPVYKAIL